MDAVKQDDGTYTDAETGDPVPDDATVTCVPGTGGGADVVDCVDGGRALLVKVCASDESPGEPCRNATSVLVCDVPASSTTGVDADLVDSTAADAGAPAGWGNRDLAGPYTALWSGGTLNIPATAGPNADTTAVAGVLTATAPAGCEDATATLNLSVRVTNNGPASGQVWDGTFQLLKAKTLVKDAPFPTSAPRGRSSCGRSPCRSPSRTWRPGTCTSSSASRRITLARSPGRLISSRRRSRWTAARTHRRSSSCGRWSRTARPGRSCPPSTQPWTVTRTRSPARSASASPRRPA
ncbi:hypothetical protein E4K10_30715 [Streptomyces sp. T1317-0309]|nr:hypothetical protein E4K10_30715 [Streptomyces sp. T1317-0309]